MNTGNPGMNNQPYGGAGARGFGGPQPGGVGGQQPRGTKPQGQNAGRGGPQGPNAGRGGPQGGGMARPEIQLDPRLAQAHIGEAHDNARFAELFKETYSEEERNKCYESTVEGCGNTFGCCGAWCPGCENPYKQVQESQFGVVQIFGRFKETKGPGLHFINPCCESLAFVDRKESFIDLKQQSIMTKDNVNIIIDAVVYFQVEDPIKALFQVQQVVQAIGEISKTTLRDIFGHITLQEALETKEKIAFLIQQLIDKPTEDWGVNINRVLIQEIKFSKDLQDNLSAAATAKRIAEGRIIQAQADVDSAKLLREASDILNTQAAMQIRYLDAITSLAKANNTKIIFMPSDASRK